MLNKRTFLLGTGALLACLFVAGIVHLFQMRLEGGDVYPPYSSLRSDPLGTKALYESLGGLPGVSVSRSYETVRKIGSGRQTTLFIPGLPVYELNYASTDEIRELETFMMEGGRIVVTVFPESKRDWSTRRNERLKKEEAEENDEGESKKKAEPAEKTPIGKKPEEEKKLSEEMANLKMQSLTNRWEYSYDFEDLTSNEEGVSEPVRVVRSGASPIPEFLWWYSAVYFKDLGEGWRTLLSRGGKPVLIEKKFGTGSLVIATDSYFLSNEALRKDRHVDLLGWLVGGNNRIVFNETHLGVQSSPGIAALARKYRLHGLFAGLALLACLFIWKNAMSLVPPHPEDVTEGTGSGVSGNDSASGFINLLRRSIPPAGIISVCFDEFKKSAKHSLHLRSALPQIEQLVGEEQGRSPRERRPVETYQKISQILSEKKHL